MNVSFNAFAALDLFESLKWVEIDLVKFASCAFNGECGTIDMTLNGM